MNEWIISRPEFSQQNTEFNQPCPCSSQPRPKKAGGVDWQLTASKVGNTSETVGLGFDSTAYYERKDNVRILRNVAD